MTTENEATEVNESATESSESAGGSLPVESIAESTAKNIASISAERSMAIIGSPRAVVFVGILDGNELKTAMVTKDFPWGDFPAALENFRKLLADDLRANADQRAEQMAARVKEVGDVSGITAEG